jgi:putative transposase
MPKTKTDSFILDLPLRVSSTQEKRLLARLEAARQVYNACMGESLKRLGLLRQSKAYQAAQKMRRGRTGKRAAQKHRETAKARACAFRKANAAVGFREYDLHAYAKQFNHCWLGEHLDINTIQKLATRAFRAVQQHAFGKRGRPRFKGRNQMDSVEGKSNASGIRWREERVEWLDLNLEAIVDRGDPVIAHGLAARVKYVRIVRRKIKGRNRFYVQLVCEGKPYQKPKNRVGEGDVGLDLGPSTIARVGEQEAFLEQFCDELVPRQKEIRRLQRQIDRQRRANNPDCYGEKGRSIKGKRPTDKSARQRKTETKLAELHRQQAAHRKSLHGQTVNRVLRMGNVFKLEKLSYLGFQRRYGRSVGMRAPGMFVALLKRKAESAGAEVIEFPTRTTRLSQTCHGCKTVKKKSLSQRWHKCNCGIEAQRDLYSAFLAQCVEDGRLNVDRAKHEWSDEGVDDLLQAALSQAAQRAAVAQLNSDQAASGRTSGRQPPPSSFGLSGQRQSGSPVESSVKSSETEDVVPSASSSWESLREFAGSLEPPAFRPGESSVIKYPEQEEPTK